MNKSPRGHHFLSGILIGAGAFFLCFGFVFWLSGASFASHAQVLVVAAAVVIYAAVIKLLDLFSRLPAMSRLPRGVLIIGYLIVAALLGYVSGYFSDPIAKALSVSPRFLDTFTGGLQFSLIIGSTLAFDRKPRQTVKQAPQAAPE